MIFCDSVVFMANRYYTADDIRKVFEAKIKGRTQVSICRELGLKAQNLSVMVNGAPINGRVLAWLGYRRVEGLYERTGKVQP